jgi:hypothetical protein
MRQTLTAIVAVIAGFLGGILGDRAMRAIDGRHPDQVVRGHRFELLDAGGNVISLWGVDAMRSTVLSFRSHDPVPREGPDGTLRSIGLDDPQNQETVIGVSGATPFLDFRAPDGRPRVSLYIGKSNKPLLLMEDESGPRLGLGISESDTANAADNDWALSFLPDRAAIGMLSRPNQGRSYVQGFLMVNKDKLEYPYGQLK